MTQKITSGETLTTRLDGDVVKMANAVAWDRKTSAAELLSPLVRRQVTKWFLELPEEIRRRFLPEPQPAEPAVTA